MRKSWTPYDDVKQAEREELVLDWRKQWHPFVLQVLARALPRRSDVPDLAQEVYLRLLRVEKLDLVRNPRAYLYRVAINIADEWRLRCARLPTAPDDSVPGHMFAATDNLEDWLSRQQDRVVIETALRALPMDQRTALVLHVAKDLTYPQIARHMGVTRRQVKRYLAKAYERLRKDMIRASIRPAATDSMRRP